MKNNSDNTGNSNGSTIDCSSVIGNRVIKVSQLVIMTLWESSDIIDMHTFKISRIRNNFYLFFNPKSMFGALYRSQDLFVKFQQKHPELVDELDALNLGIEIDSEESMSKLYEAYTLLKLANPNMTNNNLFW